MNILLIPLCTPYDKVRHAGGNICNYYLKKLLESKENLLHIITRATKEDVEVLSTLFTFLPQKSYIPSSLLASLPSILQTSYSVINKTSSSKALEELQTSTGGGQV